MIFVDQMKRCKNPELFTAIEKASQITFTALGLCGEAKVELDFVSKHKMARLNNNFRGVASATDVLSFPMVQEIMPFTLLNYPLDTDGDGFVLLGSIAICPDVAKANAQNYGHSDLREFVFLFVHGLLHLLGYDHQDEGQRTQMRQKEEEILAAVGLSR